MAFDPCREWLGIDALDLADPRRVLGVGPGESDPRVIAAAAARRLATLAAIAPGPFERARNALVERVAEARDALLEEFPALPEPVHPTPLPAPGPVVASWTGLTPPPVPAAAPHGGAATQPDPGWHEHPHTVPRRRHVHGGQGPALALLALLAAIAAGLGGFMLRGRFGAGESVRKVASATDGPRRTAPQADATAPPRRPRPEAGAVPPSRPRPPLDAEPEPGADRAPPAPEPDPPPPVAVDAAAADAIDDRLGDAFGRLRERDFTAAARAVAAAASQAGDDPAAGARIERWRLLVNVAGDVPRYLDEALAAADGNEFDVGGTRIGVIEVTADRLIYRVRGRTERVSRERAPAAVLGAILAGWFANDGRADNLVFLGAYRLLADPADVAGARREWRAAAAGGAEAGAHLLPLLDDPIVRGR